MECDSVTKKTNEAWKKCKQEEVEKQLENTKIKEERKNVSTQVKRNNGLTRKRNRDHEYRKFYKKVNLTRKRFKAYAKIHSVRNLLSSRCQVLARWVEYLAHY